MDDPLLTLNYLKPFTTQKKVSVLIKTQKRHISATDTFKRLIKNAFWPATDNEHF